MPPHLSCGDTISIFCKASCRQWRPLMNFHGTKLHFGSLPSIMKNSQNGVPLKHHSCTLMPRNGWQMTFSSIKSFEYRQKCQFKLSFIILWWINQCCYFRRWTMRQAKLLHWLPNLLMHICEPKLPSVKLRRWRSLIVIFRKYQSTNHDAIVFIPQKVSLG